MIIILLKVIKSSVLNHKVIVSVGFAKVDKTVHWIMLLSSVLVDKANYTIHWMLTYVVDSIMLTFNS